MIKEIEQIERLLESNQGAACLTFIESLEKDHPDCACLTAAKISVYRTEDRWEEALNLSREFHEKEPTNPVAASEYALALSIGGDTKTAIDVVVDAFECAKEGTAHSSLINATLQVGACMLVQGHVIPVVAIGNRIKRFPTWQEQANALLYRASSMTELPLLLRDMIFDQACPDDFPARSEFEDAIEMLALMRWKQGLAKLESLAVHADRWPNLWRDIAAVRFWLMRDEDGCKALEIYANLPNTPLEDAVDAEATRRLLVPDSLGDQISVQYIEYRIDDADRVCERLLSSRQFLAVPFDIEAFGDRDEPPPKGAFMILDKPLVHFGTEITLENTPSQWTTCLIFGKETDRPARLELMETPENVRPEVEAILRENLGDLFMPDPVKVETSGFVSKTFWLLRPRFRFEASHMPDLDRQRALEIEFYCSRFLDTWSKLPLGLFDGKTPEEAAADPTYRIRMLGTLRIFEYCISGDIIDKVIGRFYERFNLPMFGPIEIPDGSEEEQLAALDDLPVWRWYRINVEKLPTSALAEGLQIASVMKEPHAAIRFAVELLNRPMKEMPFQIRTIAFEAMITVTQAKQDFNEALDWIEKAKNETAELNGVDAGWILHEIAILMRLKQLDRAHGLINDLVRRYGNNEQIMQALQHLFIRLGLLNPDGTPTVMAGGAPAEPPAESGGLWTPDSAMPPVSEGGASKLWTPD